MIKLTQNANLEHLFCKSSWAACLHTPMICKLYVFHTMLFAVTLSKSFIHYYYMLQASKIVSTGIASIPSYNKFIIQALISHMTRTKEWCSTAIVRNGFMIHVRTFSLQFLQIAIPYGNAVATCLVN